MAKLTDASTAQGDRQRGGLYTAPMVRIEPFLLEDETLLGSCGTGRGMVCATDLRVLRVEQTTLGRRVRDISYREISSITIEDHASWILGALGLIVAALGFLLPREAP